jgi:predicted amidohydrolase YtcJ
MPGLIDAHGHVMGLGFGALQLDLSDTRSLAEAQARIAAYAAANPTPRWIVGRGWNQERWGLGRFPTAADLDSVAPGRPIWLERVDGHAGWANSLAMKEAGITAEPPPLPAARSRKGAGGSQAASSSTPLRPSSTRPCRGRCRGSATRRCSAPRR